MGWRGGEKEGIEGGDCNENILHAKRICKQEEKQIHA